MICLDLKGLKVQVYTSFFILLAIMIALNYIEQFFILFIIVTLHELTHIVVAKIFHLQTEKIIITPLGQTAIIKNINTAGIIKKIIIFISGPMANIIMFAIASIFFRGRYSFFRLANISIAIFNILPVYPLDGGRILQSLLSNKIGIIPANKLVMQLGCFFSILICALGFVQVILFPFNISLLCMGLYLYRVCKREYLFMTFEFYGTIVISKNKMNSKKALQIKSLLVSNSTDIKSMLYKICWDYYIVFNVLHNGEINRTITEQEIIDYVLLNGLHGCVKDILVINK